MGRPRKPLYIILVHMYKCTNHASYCLKEIPLLQDERCFTSAIGEDLQSLQTKNQVASEICVGTSLLQVIIDGVSGNDIDRMGYMTHGLINTLSLGTWILENLVSTSNTYIV